MTDEVGGLVLFDNYRQNQAISLMERMSVSRLGSKQHFIQTLESQGLLDRQIEFLPSDAELAERKARGQGLTRPELAVLLSYSKLVVFQQLLDSDIPEDPYLSKELQRYFPEPLQKKYSGEMEKHRLKREIIATAVTNSTINRMGATFLLRMQEDSGRSPAEVAKAFTITRETLDARTLWNQIDALDGKVPESVQIDALQVIWSLQRSFTRWLLSRPGADSRHRHGGGSLPRRYNEIRAAGGVLPDSQRPAYEAAARVEAERIAAGIWPTSWPHCRTWSRPSTSSKWRARASSSRWMSPRCTSASAKPCRSRGCSNRSTGCRSMVAGMRWRVACCATNWRPNSAYSPARRCRCRAPTPTPRSVTGSNATMPALRFTLGMLNELAAQKTLDYPTLSVAVQRLSQLSAKH